MRTLRKIAVLLVGLSATYISAESSRELSAIPQEQALTKRLWSFSDGAATLSTTQGQIRRCQSNLTFKAAIALFDTGCV